MAGQPWYKDGLRFTCTECGDCCSGAPGYVWVNKAEIASLSEQTGLDVETFENRYVRKVGVRKSLVEFSNGDCVFLDEQTRKCTVYEARPRQCRSWPFWGSNLRDEKAWRATCEECPGAGQGELVPLEEVQRNANLIRI